MPTSNQYQANDCYTTVTIASGQTASAEIDLAGTDLVGIEFPATMTSATMKIHMASSSGGTFKAVQKDEVGGGDYTITVTASKYVPVTNLAILAGCRFIKLVGASSEGADRSIVIATRPL